MFLFSNALIVFHLKAMENIIMRLGEIDSIAHDEF